MSELAVSPVDAVIPVNSVSQGNSVQPVSTASRGNAGLPASTDGFDVDAIKAELSQHFAGRALRASTYGPLFTALWQSAAQCATGGKLLRPRLLLGAFDALTPSGRHGSAYRSSAIRIATALELLHFAFLLHDDVIDGDIRRRGRPNLIGTILDEVNVKRLLAGTTASPRAEEADLHWARSNAILMGDLLVSDAHQIIAREPLPQDVRIQLLDIFDHGITESVVGEHLDVALEDDITPPTLDTVLTMTQLKTATYTFQMPLKAAAILAGSLHPIDDALTEVGAQLGVAFQLQDDLLSTFGDPSEHGKDTFSDLREGKETAIIAYARTTKQWPQIEPNFGKAQLTNPEAMHIRISLNQCGAEGFVRDLLAERLRTAQRILHAPESQLPAELVEFVRSLMEKLEARRS